MERTSVTVPLLSPPPVRPVSVAHLHDAFAHVPDPRRSQGRWFSLPAILTLAVAAILANHLAEQAIAEWGADQSGPVKRALGFPTGLPPHQSAL